MPSITQFARESEQTTIRVRNIPIEVWYTPDRITVDDMTAVARIQQTLDFGAMADFLDELVDSWDVTGPLMGEDDAGEPVELVAEGDPIPFTPECLGALGMLFVGEFIEALLGEAMTGPNPTTATRRSRKR